MATSWRGRLYPWGVWRECRKGYRLHAPRAGRLAYLLTGDREVAEDVGQEAFTRLIARLGLVRDEAHPAVSAADGRQPGSQVLEETPAPRAAIRVARAPASW